MEVALLVVEGQSEDSVLLCVFWCVGRVVMLQSSHAYLTMILPALIKHIGTKQSFLCSKC